MRCVEKQTGRKPGGLSWSKKKVRSGCETAAWAGGFASWISTFSVTKLVMSSERLEEAPTGKEDSSSWRSGGAVVFW